jgi:RNA polymerase sigma factor (TIGR02999 family)
MNHSSETGTITRLLRRWEQGDREADEELFRHVYAMLHRMASRRVRAERRDHTIQPTALINEAYLALMKGAEVKFVDRTHFYTIAARVMRRILIDHARKRAAARRPDHLDRVEIEKAQVFALDNPEFMLALDEVLNRLRDQSDRACKVVEMRIFGGLSIEEIASALGVATRTVKRDWQMARLWIYNELYGRS